LKEQDFTISNQAEEYLEAIYHLENEKGNAKTMDLAKELGVVPGSITNTIEILERKELVTHEPYKGVTLTKTGQKIALSVLRRHRLAERLLTDVLHLAWSEVHDPACKLEHALTPKILKSLETKLEHPQKCPHGNPIPKEDGSFQEDDSIPLTELKSGENGIIQKIVHEKTSILESLENFGLVPDSHVKIIKKPFSGSLELEVDGKKKNVEQMIAKHVHVTLPRFLRTEI